MYSCAKDYFRDLKIDENMLSQHSDEGCLFREQIHNDNCIFNGGTVCTKIYTMYH